MRPGQIAAKVLAIAGAAAVCIAPALAQHSGGGSHASAGGGGGHLGAPASPAPPAMTHFSTAISHSGAPTFQAKPAPGPQPFMAPSHLQTKVPPQIVTFGPPVEIPFMPPATSTSMTVHSPAGPVASSGPNPPVGKVTPAISNPILLPRRPIAVFPIFYGYPPYFFGSPFHYGFGYCPWGFSPYQCFALNGGSPWGSPSGFNGFGYPGYGASYGTYGLGYDSGTGYTGGDSSAAYAATPNPNQYTSDGSAYNADSTYVAPSQQDAASAAPSDTPSTTILFFTDRTSTEATSYWVAQDELHFITSYGGTSSVPLAQLDVNRTVQENAQRGISISLQAQTPASPQP
jgi:hypothetical protein